MAAAATTNGASASPRRMWSRGRSRRSSADLAIVTLPVRTPQLELLQLPGRRAGQLRAELDALGDLVAGEAGAAVLPEVVLGDALALDQHDQAEHHLAP